MKRTLLSTLLLGMVWTVNAQTLPTKQQVLDKMTLANTYFMTKWPDPTAVIVTNKSRPSNLWTRGTYYEGLMQLYYLTQNASLLQYAVDWGTFHKWQPTYTGTVATRIADNQCCFQTYLELFQLDPTKTERMATAQISIDAMVNSTKVNDWWWIDAMHMAMPVFAKFGLVKNDTKYYEKMYDLYNYTKSQAKGVGLYNAADSLWYRDSVYLPPTKSPNGLPVYWSRGNGWVFAALTRTLDVIAANAPHRSEYLSTFRQMAAKLIRLQRTDGFWNVNLGDPNDYGGKETSGTVFFTYGLAWGINHNLLDSATYYPAVTKAWNALITDALHANGALGWVQSAGSKPADGQPLSYDKMPDFEDFGLGGFLLAGSEVYKLAKVSNSSTGINEPNNSQLELSAYPNPFAVSTRIYFQPTSANARIVIMNSAGQQVYSFSTESTKPVSFTWNGTTNNGKALPNGLYILLLHDGNLRQTVRIVLQK
jgi:Predicted unsaturated glucuronyl hydrolase involved in regulation of bacterial surface properties, and related proteins